MYGRRAMYNGVYTHYPSLPYRHYGVNICRSYNIPQSLPPIPDVNISISPYCRDYPYRHGIPYIDYPYYNYVPPPIVQTNVQNDIYYTTDDRDLIYDDVYGHTYKLCRSKYQLVDIVPKNNVRTTRNRIIAPIYESKEPPERIIVPRQTVVRHKSLPPYERPKPMRILPLYHSADPHYLVSRRRTVAKELIPVATTYNSYGPYKRTIKVRSLSP